MTQGNYSRAVDTFFHGTLDTVFAAMGGIAIGGLIRSVAHNGLRATYNQFFRSCFAAGTPLLMAHGGSKPIDQINVGDWVLARSDADEHGEIAPRQVGEVFVRSAELLELVVSGQIIKTTMEHPFWVVDAGWRDAHELNVGDRLLSHDGQELTLHAIRDTGEYATVYNLRIAEYHTYFVGCAERGWSVWAHNSYDVDARVNARMQAEVEADLLRITGNAHLAENLAKFGGAMDTNGLALRYAIHSGEFAALWNNPKTRNVYMGTLAGEIQPRMAVAMMGVNKGNMPAEFYDNAYRKLTNFGELTDAPSWFNLQNNTVLLSHGSGHRCRRQFSLTC